MRTIFSSKGQREILYIKEKEGKKEIKISPEQGWKKYVHVHYKLGHVRS